MNRTILINNGYISNVKASEKRKNIYKNKYCIVNNSETVGGNNHVVIMPTLSEDVDIFNQLPTFVYENKDAKEFLATLRNALLSVDLSGITLSKLCVSEHTESGVVIDWIYNYFRIFFSFDKEDGNFYGVISSNPEEKSFSNDFRAMNSNQYEVIAQKTINYVIQMIHA